MPVLAYGALAGGILTGKYLDPERSAYADTRTHILARIYVNPRSA